MSHGTPTTAGFDDGDAPPSEVHGLGSAGVGTLAVVPPVPGDTALFHELKRRLATAALQAADKGMVERAIATLDTLATSGASEKVRAAAARDLLRTLGAYAEPARGPAQRNTLNVTVTAADLVGKADKETLHLAMEAVRAARMAGRPVLASQAACHTGGGGGGSVSVTGGPVEVPPSARVTGSPKPAGPVHPAPPAPIDAVFACEAQPVFQSGQGTHTATDPSAGLTMRQEAEARAARRRLAAGRDPEPGTFGVGEPLRGDVAPW